MLSVMTALAFIATLSVAGMRPASNALHDFLVVRPVSALDSATRGNLLLALLLIGIGGAIVCFAGGDGTRMLVTAAPDIATWLMTFEVSAYLDALSALAAAAMLTRLQPLHRLANRSNVSASRSIKFGSRPRSKHRHAVKLPANDDEDGAVRTIAS